MQVRKSCGDQDFNSKSQEMARPTSTIAYTINWRAGELEYKKEKNEPT